MQLIHSLADIKRQIAIERQNGSTIGLVPTMGVLHEGHLSLIDAALKDHSFVVVSIFVNPKQFGPNEDYEKYPRTLDADRELLLSKGVHCLFNPSEEEIYLNSNSITVDVGTLGKVLCGKSRPGHFNAVSLIVLKLFSIVEPTTAYFGRKDFQQSVIIQKMVQDFNLPVEIKILPTVRENDGLALSSRNRYLTSEERSLAPMLYQTLVMAKEVALYESSVEIIKNIALAEICKLPEIKIDYFEIVDNLTLEPLAEINHTQNATACIAAYIGNTRLIDNLQIFS